MYLICEAAIVRSLDYLIDDDKYSISATPFALSFYPNA